MDEQKAKAFQRLKELRAQADDLKYEDRENGRLDEWERGVKTALIRLFGNSSQVVKDFGVVRFGSMPINDYSHESDWHASFRFGLINAKSLLNAAIQEIVDYDLHAPPGSDSALNAMPLARKAFVVHGHDNEMKEAVARFLERLGLAPIILHEQASAGATVIEKIEKNADVGFAVVLLSPDDVGARASDREKLNPRARQNVLLELGYFLGRLGRNRVVAILRGKLEVPSDLEGVVYIPFEGEGWKLNIVRELKAIGYDVDASAAF
jgi:predicted nucleotide-binding protein